MTLLLALFVAVGELSPSQMLTTAVVSLVTFIGGCLAYLRTVDTRQQRQLTRMEEKLDECETDRNELWEALSEMGGRPRRKQH